MNSKRELTTDVVHEQLISTIYEQSILLPIDDTMAEDLIVSCCAVANDSVAHECQMVNPDGTYEMDVHERGTCQLCHFRRMAFILIFPSI